MLGLVFAVSVLALSRLTTASESTTGTKTASLRKPGYADPLSRRLGLGHSQSVQMIASADTVYGTRLWRLRPSCHKIPFANLDFAAEFTHGIYNGRSNARDLPSCDDPALISQLTCPPLQNNSDSLKKLQGYKNSYLRKMYAHKTAPSSYHTQEIQRSLMWLRGRVRVVDEVDALWEGPTFVARVFIVMDACDASLIFIANQLALGSPGKVLPKMEDRHRRSPNVRASPPSCQPACPRGKGGNKKLGIVPFGAGSKEVCLDVLVNNGRFYLENQFVVVHDARKRPSSKTGCRDIPVVNFDCDSGPMDSVNDSQSPSYDAVYGVGVIRDVINEWYPEISEDMAQPLHVCTHFGANYANSAWNGKYILLGDGEPGKSRPFTTLDSLAHEYAHYLTETYSRLLLVGQVGGIQDAFSDAFAKVVDAFTNGGSKVRSWLLGPGILQFRAAIRDMQNPKQDGRSIDTASDFKQGMDSHYACGVFNKFFHCMVQTKGESIRETFRFYLMANKVRWNYNDNFTEGACHLLQSAYDLGVNTDNVLSCMRSVGLLTDPSHCPLSAVIRTVCEDSNITVQASKTRQPFFRVCKKSSRVLRVRVFTSAKILISRRTPYSPATRMTQSCGGIIKYTGSLDGKVFIRIVGKSNSLQTVQFGVSFVSGGSDDDDDDSKSSAATSAASSKGD